MQCKSSSNKPKNRLFQASVDRIDSNKPYSVDNIEIVCLGINYLKNTMSRQDVLEFLSMVE